MIEILSNSNPEVATFEVVDEQIICHALSAGQTIVRYDRGYGPEGHEVNVA